MSVEWSKPGYGFVYVDPPDVKSIITNGYLSARKQVEMGKTTLWDLEQKYGSSHLRALNTYHSECPDDILDYLDWRTGDEDDSCGDSNAIYFLFEPLTPLQQMVHPFTYGKSLSSLDIRGMKQHIVNAQGDGGLWFSDIRHAYVLPATGLIPPEKVRIVY